MHARPRIVFVRALTDGVPVAARVPPFRNWTNAVMSPPMSVPLAAIIATVIASVIYLGSA